jgi:hypothetical protein
MKNKTVGLLCAFGALVVYMFAALYPATVRSQSMLFLGAGGSGGGGGGGICSTSVATDNFMRSNQNPIAGNWTNAPPATNTAQLLSNQFTGADGAFAGRIYYWNANSFTSNMCAQVVWEATDGFGYGGPAINVQTGSSMITGYVAQMQGPSITRYDSGTPTTIASPTGTFTVGDTIRLVNNSGVLTLYKNGTALTGTATDTTYTGGSPGIYLFDGSAGTFALGAFQAASR